MSDPQPSETVAAASEDAEKREDPGALNMDTEDTPTSIDTSTDHPTSSEVLKQTDTETEQQTEETGERRMTEDSAQLPATGQHGGEQFEELKERDVKEEELQDAAAVVSMLEPSAMDDSDVPTDEEEGRTETVPAEGSKEEPPKPKALKGEDKEAPPPPSSTSHVYHKGWSTLSKEEIVDRIKGVIYGQAIGDAFGLATEFMDRKTAQRVYGKNGPTSYREIAQDFHRMRWTPGDWTDDTDQMLLILQGMVENSGVVNRLDFARRIQHWMRHGFEELGDYGGMGIGMTVHRTLSHHLFSTDPHSAAREVWESSGRYLAANGAIMRTSILGVLNFNDLDKVIKNTKEISQCTHADPRCTASCIAVTVAIALILQGVFDPMKDNEVSSLIDTCLFHADKALSLLDQVKEMKEHVLASSVEKLKLDEAKAIGYTFKALGAGFYGLRTVKNFRDTITEVIMQAGDADSNGAVCGALMGCKLGFKALPPDLLKFPNRQWLDNWVEQLLRTIGLSDTPL